MRCGALIVAAGCLVAVSGGCAGQQQVSLHQQQVLLQGYSGSAIVSADGRTITVGDFGSYATAVTRESATKVALFLQEVTSAGTSCSSCPHEGSFFLVSAQNIRLREPLGSRKLVDGATGRAIAWMSARLVLRPRLIPAGYRSTGLLPWMSSSLYMGGVRSAACMQIYQLQNAAEEFEIIQSAAGLQLQYRGDWKPIWVRGHPGRAAAGMITWREHGLTDLISASGLTTSQLIAIANSAPA
jgi:hypothetical protein